MKQVKLGAGSRIVYEWTEGAFAGNVFQVDLLADGRLTWRVLEGHEPGSGATEEYPLTAATYRIGATG